MDAPFLEGFGLEQLARDRTRLVDDADLDLALGLPDREHDWERHRADKQYGCQQRGEDEPLAPHPREVLSANDGEQPIHGPVSRKFREVRVR